MSSINIAATVFAFSFGGAILGMFLRGRLPQGHLDKESQDVIMLATGLISAMAALVLGLLVAAASSEYDTKKNGFNQLATNVIVLDRALMHFGPEAQTARQALKETAHYMVEHLWPKTGTVAKELASPELTKGATRLFEEVRKLPTESEGQKDIQAKAIEIMTDLGQTRWQLTQQDSGSIPHPFMAVLTFWLLVLFMSFGLFSPKNLTVIIALFVCALSVAGAIFLIVDLDQPFDGLIQISNEPLRMAIAQLGV